MALITGNEISDIEIINFTNPHNSRMNPAYRAITNAEPVDSLDGIRVVTPEYLVALKMYAGSSRDIGDAVELIGHQDFFDWEVDEALAKRYGLKNQLERIRSECA